MSPDLLNEFGIAFLETAWMLTISVTLCSTNRDPTWNWTVCDE